MKLALLRWVMCRAWDLEELARAFTAWAEQNYSNEVHGIGSIE